MLANILPAYPFTPPPPKRPWMLGHKVKFKLSEHGHAAYQIKWNHKCSNMVANILPAYSPSLTLWIGVKRSIFILSEYGRDAYQIKGNDTSCNMEANIFTRWPHTPKQPWGVVNIQLYQNNVMLQIKLIAIRNEAKCSKYFARRPPTPLPPSTTLGVGLKINFFGTWSCCISIKRISRILQHGSKCFACRPPPVRGRSLSLCVNHSSQATQ